MLCPAQAAQDSVPCKHSTEATREESGATLGLEQPKPSPGAIAAHSIISPAWHRLGLKELR